MTYLRLRERRKSSGLQGMADEAIKQLKEKIEDNMAIHCKLSAILARIEIETRKTYEKKELARLFGTTKRYITLLLEDKATSINFKVLTQMLTFFHEQGYYYTLNDIFTFEESGLGCPS